MYVAGFARPQFGFEAPGYPLHLEELKMALQEKWSKRSSDYVERIVDPR